MGAPRSNDRDRQLRLVAVKLAVFAVVALAVTLTIAATIRPLGGSSTGSYRAIFSSASRLAAGDDVRVSGVIAGKVDGVKLLPDATAEVDFTLDQPLDLTTGTRAAIRYVNLVGDRTLTLIRGGGEHLRDDGTIPLTQTDPALDLNELFDGFKPLFAALTPSDVNGLAMDIIRTLQGEGPTVTSLLEHTASLTRTVADRDVLIGQVIDNLNVVLGTVDDQHGRLDQLVRELTRFVGGLSGDRAAVGSAIDQIGRVTDLTAGLLRQARPGLRSDIAELRTIATTLNAPANQKLLEHLVEFLPTKYAEIARTASYGSWFNYYACELSVKLVGANGDGLGLFGILIGKFGTINLVDPAKRCRS